MTYNLPAEDEEECYTTQVYAAKPCRLCGKPTTPGHLYNAHHAAWTNYLASKIDFGMSVFSVVSPRIIRKSKIRS